MAVIISTPFLWAQFLSHKNKNRRVFIKTSLQLSFMAAKRVFVTRHCHVGCGSRSKYKNAILNINPATGFEVRTLTIKSKCVEYAESYTHIFIRPNISDIAILWNEFTLYHLSQPWPLGLQRKTRNVGLFKNTNTHGLDREKVYVPMN